ncbi:hypothetical protein NHX12_025988 [Muraenolepis orangiensis]|uniref:Uncharacterized protein n=1 Tax=Muraenolepis orangiensis TaxID=630683 RepID=A0A9Q0ELC5_9TELE|nr:hypothetical protein NHX12_025988 [Muraenolepis orangiensis]
MSQHHHSLAPMYYREAQAAIAVYDITNAEAQVYADDNSLLFLETSAKTALNVNEVFMAIGCQRTLRGAEGQRVVSQTPE